jgi:hypothetical protein
MFKAFVKSVAKVAILFFLTTKPEKKSKKRKKTELINSF